MFSIQYNNGTIVLHNLCNNLHIGNNCTSEKVYEVAFARNPHYNNQTKNNYTYVPVNIINVNDYYNTDIVLKYLGVL